jgi:hypothetical protein
MSLLGQFYWYSIPPKMISVERARRAWRRVGLPDGYLPASRKPADVAAEACGSVDRSSAPFALTQVENSSRRLLYEVTSGVGGEVIELVFNKQTADFASLDAELLRRVRAIYEQNGSRLPDHKMRRAVRAVLLDVGGENLHGSIYLMPRRGRTPEPHGIGETWLGWMQSVVLELYGEEAVFHRVPAPATADQIDYVRSAVTRILVDEVNELVAEVSGLLEAKRSRKWRSDKITTIKKRADDLQARYERFVDVVDELGQVSDVLPGLHELVGELVDAHEPPVVT